MIAAGDHVDALRKQLLGQARRDAEACGGVFPIGHHQIRAALRHDIGQMVGHELPARRADDVANK